MGLSVRPRAALYKAKRQQIDDAAIDWSSTRCGLSPVKIERAISIHSWTSQRAQVALRSKLLWRNAGRRSIVKRALLSNRRAQFWTSFLLKRSCCSLLPSATPYHPEQFLQPPGRSVYTRAHPTDISQCRQPPNGLPRAQSIATPSGSAPRLKGIRSAFVTLHALGGFGETSPTSQRC